MGFLKKLKKLLTPEMAPTPAQGAGVHSGSVQGEHGMRKRPETLSMDGTAAAATTTTPKLPAIRRAETDLVTSPPMSQAEVMRQATAKFIQQSHPGMSRTSTRNSLGGEAVGSAPHSPAVRSPGAGVPLVPTPPPPISLAGGSFDDAGSTSANSGMRKGISSGVLGRLSQQAPPSNRPSNAGAANGTPLATPNGGMPAHRDSNSSISSMLSQKMKKMVFVEAPATIEVESGAEPLVLPGGPTPLQGIPPVPPSLPSPPAGVNPSARVDPKVFRRVQRIRSVPMLIDTNPLHHQALRAQAQPKDSTAGGQPTDDEAAAAAAVADEQARQASAQVVRTKRSLRRHASLKHLLQLDSYDFVSDVNVAEAQQEVDSGDEGEGGAGGAGRERRQDPLSILQAMTANMADTNPPEKESNILAVNKALPRGMRRSMWSVRDFTLSKRLHQGYASDVYFAKCNLTGELVVLKVYRLADQCDLQRVQLYREIRVHSRLQHQNIVQFYAAFLEDKCVVIVQEYAAGGDLLRYMYKYGGRLTERQAVNLVLQPFLSALLYLHTQGIIHRDIKPENCLLTDTRLLKLADFGLAVDLNEERANTRAGTLDYMAPEVLRCPTKQTPDQFKSTPGAAHYQMGADAWAVGVFAYELIAGGPPFKADQMIDTARNIISVNITYPATISELARDFIAACLRKHPGDRPTVIEMLHHPWIQMFQRRASVRTPAVMGPFTHRPSAGGQDPSSPGGSAQGGHHHASPHGLHGLHGPSPLNPTGSPRTMALAQQQQALAQQQHAQALAYQQQAQAQRLQRVG